MEELDLSWTQSIVDELESETCAPCIQIEQIPIYCVFIDGKQKVVSMQKGPYKVEKATPGGSLAIETELDPSLGKSDSLSGGVVGLKGTLPEITEILKIKYSTFDKVMGDTEHDEIKELAKNEMLMLSVNTSTTVGQVVSVKNGEVELSLKIPVVPLKGSSIGIARNFGGHWRLIGVGDII